MKYAKKWLTLLLALAMGLAPAMPAFAAAEPNPAMPVITMDMLIDMAPVKYGKQYRLDLTIQAVIPNGDPIGYQWYEWYEGVLDPRAIPGANAPSYTVHSMNTGGANPSYYCVVFNANDETLAVTSRPTVIWLERPPPSLGDRILECIEDWLAKIAARLYPDLDPEEAVFVLMFRIWYWSMIIFEILLLLIFWPMILFDRLFN